MLPCQLLRGVSSSCCCTDAVRFDRVTMSGGGIQYQQNGADCGGIGWWDLYTVALEDAATPMLVRTHAGCPLQA